MEFKNLRNWKYKRIEEISDTVTDYVANGSFATLKKNTVYAEKSDYILIRLVDYNNNFNGDFKYITPKSYDFLNKTKLYGGEIIISNVGANAGTVFKVPYLKHKMSLGPNSILLKTKENDEFYFYWFRSIFGQFSLDSIKTGSAQPKFNKTDFRKLSVPVPERDEQNKIAKILNTLDSKIEINNKIISNLESQAQAIFKSWFVDFEPFQDGNFVESELGMIPKGWEVGKLGKSKLGKIIGSGIEKFNGEKIYLATADVSDTAIINTSTIIYFNKRPSRANMQPKPKTIWFAKMKESRKLILVDDIDNEILENMIFSTGFAGIECNESSLYYLWTYIITEEFDKIKNSYCEGTTMQAINNKNINKILIIVPKDDVLDNFRKIVGPLFKNISRLKVQNKKLAEIRDALLPKLMSGEIDVSNIKVKGKEVKNE